MCFEIIGLEHDRADHVLARLGCALHRPGFVGRDDLAEFEIERLHHLAHESVGQNDSGIAIPVREFEGENGEVRHLLHGRGGDDEIAIIAVASAFDHGKVVALLGSDIAQTGTSTHDVDNDTGQFRTREIGDAFLHQADAGAGRTGHHSHAGRGCAVHHIDGSGLALGLHESSADFGKIERGGLGNFAGGGDGISVVGAASSQHCALDDGNVTFTKLAHVRLRPALSTPASEAAPAARR